MRKRSEGKKSGGRALKIAGDSPLNLNNLLKRKESPLNDPVWEKSLSVIIGSGVIWILSLLGASKSAIGIWIVAIIAGLTWFQAVRVLFLETKLKKFWIVWLSASLVFVVFFNYVSSTWVIGLIFTFLFLLFRKYRPYRYLSSKRRASLFLFSFAALVVLTVFWRFSYPGLTAAAAGQGEAAARAAVAFFPGLGLNISSYCVWSLRFFFAFSMLNLFFAVRLHFLKIKSKLAVSALLLIMVPVALLIIMEVVILYSVLGESRAVRASAVLRDWAELSAKDENLASALSGDESYVFGTDASPDSMPPPPPWLKEFLRIVEENPSSTETLHRDGSGFYLWHAAELWLVTHQARAPDGLALRTIKVDQPFMDRLAGIIQSDVIITVSNPISIERVAGVRTKTIEVDPREGQELEGRYPDQYIGAEESPPPSAETSIWRRRFYFGMTHLDVITLGAQGFERLSVLLLLKTCVSDIVNEVFSARNPLGIAFVVGITTVAGLMFILEVFALIFGLRVVTGITSAVKALHQGTRRIAKGDLETKTTIPNEDELGDLAGAFNEMSAAVKKGREEAVAREKLERELDVAREIQERLLPHEMPSVPGFEISGTSLPSQQVSGDYFDFLDMESGRVGIAIADVSGKGIPAALLMANLQASLHGQAVETGEVSKVVSKINDLLSRSTDDYMFATFFYGILDRNASSFTYTNAGHNPPFLFRPDGSYERLNPGGLLIGFMPRQNYEQRTLTLQPGEVVVLFTDGITEAVRPGAPTQELKYFGEERLVDVLRENLSRSAGEIQVAILGAVSAHMEGKAASDDITLVVIKRRPD